MKTANFDLGDTRLLIAAADKKAMLRNQLAYLLATVYWETDGTMKPIREGGGSAYLKGKKYFPYIGRGYVQVTWSRNYKKAAKSLGLDEQTFIKNPDGLLDPKYAVPICINGMLEGWFTSKRLSDYITLTKSDFEGARFIINGTDKAKEIAAIAQTYDAALLHAAYGVGGITSQAAIPVATPALKAYTPSVLDKAHAAIRNVLKR